MPNLTQVRRHCEKHGDYVAKVWEIPCRISIESPCPVCHAAATAVTDQARNKSAEWSANTIMRNAGLGARYDSATFESFNTKGTLDTDALGKVREYAANFKRSGSPNLFITGRIGNGKTHLASAMVKMLVRREFSVAYIPLSNLMTEYNDIINNRDAGSSTTFFAHYSNIDLLIIDEFGMRHLTVHEKEVLHRIVDSRYNQLLPVVIIGNLISMEYADVEINGVIEPGLHHFMDERTLRRLAENAMVASLRGRKVAVHG